MILCRLAGIFEEYVPVFLAGKNVYRTLILQEGVVILQEQLLCAGIVWVSKLCADNTTPSFYLHQVITKEFYWTG